MCWTSRLLALASTLLLGACSTFMPGSEVRFAHPVSVTEIVKLSQAGVEPDVIVRKMNLSGVVYNLTDEQAERLRGLGVTPQVLEYMSDSYDQALAEYPKLAEDAYLACWYLGWDGVWYGGGPQGFHPDCR